FSATYNTTIVSGGSQVVTVKFTPVAGQTYSGSFTINTNAGVTNVWLSGTGVASYTCNPTVIPNIGYYPSSCDINNNAAGTQYSPQTGIIKAAIHSIDCANKKIIFEFRRCDGGGF